MKIQELMDTAKYRAEKTFPEDSEKQKAWSNGFTMGALQMRDIIADAFVMDSEQAKSVGNQKLARHLWHLASRVRAFAEVP